MCILSLETSTEEDLRPGGGGGASDEFAHGRHVFAISLYVLQIFLSVFLIKYLVRILANIVTNGKSVKRQFDFTNCIYRHHCLWLTYASHIHIHTYIYVKWPDCS